MAQERLGLGPIPPSPDKYDRLNEAAFRATVDRLRQDVERFVLATRGTLEDDITTVGLGHYSLSELLTEDGAGSLLDADLLDGVEGAGYSLSGHSHLEADITDLTHYSLATLLTEDGAGSGLDADKLDGVEGAGYSLSGHSHLEADITDLQAYLLGITAEPFSDLSDVTISAIAANEVLKWNGSAWVNQTFSELAIPHDVLAGLTDDDHLQYLTEVRAAALMLAAGGTLLHVTPGNIKSLPGFSHSRTGPATYTDVSGITQTAADGELRNHHYINGVRHFWPEGASTNELPRSEEFDDAAWVDRGTPIVTADDAVAPDGTTTADKIEDDDAVGETEARRDSIVPPDDSTSWTGSVFVKRRSGGSNVTITMDYFGGTRIVAHVNFDPFTGDIDTGSIGGVQVAADSFGAEAIGDDWWRIWNTLANNGTGHATLTFGVKPATGTSETSQDITATGFNHFWGAQLENLAFPTSYIPTAGSAVTRNADSLSVGYPHNPQTATFYVKGVERGTALIQNARLWQVGADGGGANAAVSTAGNKYNFQYFDGTTSDDSGTAGLTVVTFGDTVETRAVHENTRLTIGQSLNGAAEEIGTDSTVPAFVGSWAAPVFRINQRSSGNIGFFAFETIRIATSIPSMDALRAASAIAGIAADIVGQATHTHLEADITDLTHYSLATLLTEDGAGSLLDADLLDGVEGAGYSLSGHSHLEADITDLQAYLLGITAEPLSDLSDATISAIAANEVLKWNGSAWINQTLAEANIAAVGHGHTASDVSDFSAASDARIALATIADLALTTITAIASGELLTWDGAKWINETLAEAGIQAAGAFLTDITGEPIGDLSDVTISAIASGELLKWNGSAFINQTLAEAGISATGHKHATLDANSVEGIGLAEASGHILLTQEEHAGLTASTTQTQGQGALLSSLNEVATVANANDVVTLPAVAGGLFCIVINNGVNTLQIFPASGDDLGAGVNTAETIAAGVRRAYIGIDATNWHGA